MLFSFKHVFYGHLLCLWHLKAGSKPFLFTITFCIHLLSHFIKVALFSQCVIRARRILLFSSYVRNSINRLNKKHIYFKKYIRCSMHAHLSEVSVEEKCFIWEQQNYRITCYLTTFASYKHLFTFLPYSKIPPQNMSSTMSTTKFHLVLQIPVSTVDTTKKFGKEKNLQSRIPHSVFADFEPNRPMLLVFSSLKLKTFLIFCKKKN